MVARGRQPSVNQLIQSAQTAQHLAVAVDTDRSRHLPNTADVHDLLLSGHEEVKEDEEARGHGGALQEVRVRVQAGARRAEGGLPGRVRALLGRSGTHSMGAFARLCRF